MAKKFEFEGFTVKVEPDSDELGFISRVVVTPDNPPFNHLPSPVVVRQGYTHFIRQGERVLKITTLGEVLVDNSKQAS